MQQRNDLHDDPVAPSPVVPIYRPSSQLGRRGHSNMSALPAGDGQSSMPLDAHMNREAVPELVQLFQAQSASAANPQSNGARDIFKAGHRRLRQFALRPRKTTDPRSKAEEASRQLLALQEEGFLPAPKAKKPLPPKNSIDSTISCSQSATNLSVRSDSRRDVERIGQPWLGDPLERVHSHEPNGTHLSSLDLRELTSLVQSAVSFPPQLEDSIPPPYQPSPQPAPAPATGLLEKPLKTDTSSERSEANKQAQDQNAVPPTSSDSSDKLPSGDGPTNDHPRPEEKKPQETKPTEAPQTSDTQATSQPPSNPASQTLKLFPDTLPPRVSSKAAWRISNSRSPGPNRLITESLQSPTFGSMQTGQPGSIGANDRLKSNPGRLIFGGKEMTATSTRGNRSLTNSPIHERFPQHRNIRRPSSLPLGAINSFPLPAPMRPLPSLPEPVAAINAKRGQALTVNGKPTAGRQTPTLQPSHSSPEVSSNIRPESDNAKPAATTQTETKNETESGQSQETCKKDDTIQIGITPFVRNGQTRAERVRALKMKDLSAGRLNTNGDISKGGMEQPLRSPRFQTIPEGADEGSNPETRVGDVKEDPEDQDANKDTNDVASSALSPPALNLQPRPANQHKTGKRSSSSPMHFKAPSAVSNRSSLSTSNRSSGVSRSSSARSSNVSRDRNDGQDIYSRSETPLPSSDDECMGRHKYEYQHHPSPTKKRRLKPAPIVVDGGAPKPRYVKKQSSYGFPMPTTPPKRSRVLERMSPQSQQSQSTFYSQDSRGSRHYQSAYVLNLESRITHLERQNKMLQAALLAALDLGDKPSLETLLGGSASSLSPPDTGRSFSSMTHASSFDERPARHERQKRSKPRPPYQPETWIASPGSSRRSSYSDDSGEHVRELEEMMEDFDFGWMSDKSCFDRVQRPGIRA